MQLVAKVRRVRDPQAMALEHAILVSLSEKPAAGLDLARRFDRSIGFFWSATHQQIYKVLRRMEDDGWASSSTVPQQGRPDKKVYTVTGRGRQELRTWLAAPVPMEQFRSEIAVKLRGASFGDRASVLDNVRDHLANHRTRLAHYERLAADDFADPGSLEGKRLDIYLVLRGGIRLEHFWVDWLSEYLQAHEPVERTDLMHEDPVHERRALSR